MMTGKARNGQPREIREGSKVKSPGGGGEKRKEGQLGWHDFFTDARRKKNLVQTPSSDADEEGIAAHIRVRLFGECET